MMMTFSVNIIMLLSLLAATLSCCGGRNVAAANKLEDIRHSSLRRQVEVQEEEPKTTGVGTSRIVGGTSVTDPNKYPFYAHWDICGASLVAPDVLLTAAHCRSHSTVARIGRIDKNSEEDVIQRTISTRVKHPEFIGGSYLNYDFQLLKLTQAVTTVTPIQLNTNINLPMPQQEMTVIGLGRLKEGGLTPTQLQELQVQYIPTDDCNADYYNVPGIRPVSMMCMLPVLDDEDRGTCGGDSGGPLFTKNEDDGTFLQYGVVSFINSDCGDTKSPDISARISGEIDWIIETICDLTESSNDLEMCQEKDVVQRSPTTVDVTLKITYDDYAAETGWYFQHENGEVVRDPFRYEHMFNNPLYDTPGGPYEHTVSLYPGEEASFTISDLYGDGNCCEFGNGQYEVWYKNGDDEDDLLLLEGKGDFRRFRTETFTVPGEKEIDKAPPVEFIGEAEDYVSAGESLGIGCFSGSTLVHRRREQQQTNGKEQEHYYKWIPLSEIQIGDSIQVSPGGRFEPIYAFGHYQPEKEGDYLELQFTDGNNKSSFLQISKEHLIWTSMKGAIPACDLTIGQEVILAEAGGASSTTTTTLTGIQPITAKGIYAPFTPSGTLVLNHGLLASSYISLDNFTNKMMIPNYYHHALAHFFTTPHRLWCQGTANCSNPTYTKDGINVWESQLLLWTPRIIMAGLLLCGLLFLFIGVGQLLVSKK